MLRYIIRRLLWGVVLLFAVVAITFIVFYLLPNVNPAELRAGRNSNPRIIAEIAHDLGTDRPVYVQLWDYIKQHGLQDQQNKRMINADDNLKKIFGGKKQVSMFEMTALVNKHLKA